MTRSDTFIDRLISIDESKLQTCRLNFYRNRLPSSYPRHGHGHAQGHGHGHGHGHARRQGHGHARRHGHGHARDTVTARHGHGHSHGTARSRSWSRHGQDTEKFQTRNYHCILKWHGQNTVTL